MFFLLDVDAKQGGFLNISYPLEVVFTFFYFFFHKLFMDIDQKISVKYTMKEFVSASV